MTIIHERFIGSAFFPYWLVTFGVFLSVWLLTRSMQKQRPEMKGQWGFPFSLLVAYIVLLYSYTVLCRQTGVEYVMELSPFWSYYQAFVLHRKLMLFWIVVNLVMLVPVGFLVPAVLPKMSGKKVMLAGLMLSYSIEFSQLLLHRGTFELFDDPINNMIGCLAGYMIGRAVFGKGRQTENPAESPTENPSENLTENTAKKQTEVLTGNPPENPSEKPPENLAGNRQ